MPVSADDNPRQDRHRSRAPGTLVLFNYDWDRLDFGRWTGEFPHDQPASTCSAFPAMRACPAST